MSEWTIKYSTKNGVMYTHPEKGVVEIVKSVIGGKTTWRMSEIPSDRYIKDVHGLTKGKAVKLAMSLMV